MEALATALQIALALGLPVLVIWIEPRSKVVRFLSPVVVCYGLGMLLGNQPWVPFSDAISLGTCNVTVALAIPLLLYSTDVVAWLKLAKSTVLSFVFVMLSVMLSGALAHLIFGARMPESPQVAGMLVGVYTGGTPNMAAIATALQVESQTFILANAADMVVSFAYLFFILMLAGRLLKNLVPATPRTGPPEEEAERSESGGSSVIRELPSPKGFAASLGLTAVIVAAGVGVGVLVSGGARDAVIILVITSGAVVASSVERIRTIRGTQDVGQFLLLVFCVAMGFTTDFAELFSSPSSIFGFTAVVLGGAVVFHFALAIAFRIDRDTIIITSAAGVFGPHMVGPVAVAIKNREVVFSGIASGLVGYAAGNYLGMALAWMLS